MKTAYKGILQSRDSIEETLLKALFFYPETRDVISEQFMAADFSQDNRSFYTIFLNLLKQNQKISKQAAEQLLGWPIPESLFEGKPSYEEVEKAVELFNRKIFNHRKALEKITSWKRTIDDLTLMVEEGKLEPKIWVEKVQDLVPAPRIESGFVAENREKLANLEAVVRKQDPRLIDDDIISDLKQNSGLKSCYLNMKSIWDNVYGNLQAYQKPTAIELKTGFSEIDDRLGGLSGISVLAGPPKKGKTSFSLQLAFETVVHNDSFLIYYTTDNRPESLYCKLLSQISGIPVKTIIKAEFDKMTDMQKHMLSQAMDFVNGLSNRIFIIGNDMMPKNKEQFRTQIESVISGSNCLLGLIVIDTLNIFADSLDWDNRHDSVSETLIMFRNLQTEYDIVFFGTTYSDNSASSQRLRYMVDNIFDMRFGAGKAATDSHNFSKDGYLDLVVTSREFGDFNLPLALSKDSLSFVTRKKAFKARQIVWDKHSDQIQTRTMVEVDLDTSQYASSIGFIDNDI